LIDLPDRCPRHLMHAMSTGVDPSRVDENRAALHTGLKGAELMRAVKRGRLWLNLTRVDQVDKRFRTLIDSLYAGLSAQVADFVVDSSHGGLLISSPEAMAYFHVDGPASVLWHMRGRKQVWVYPAGDHRLVCREALEDIFAGARHEYLPFSSDFDAAAQRYILEPGAWITWAQNALHRISNLDSLNVSVVTEHFTAQTRRRSRVQVANRFLRLRAGLSELSQREDGLQAGMKVFVHRVARIVGLDRVQHKRHVPTLRVDPEAPGGVTPLDAGPGAAR
jgi:hypothetical protein